jgi:hypothetical protein
LKNRSSDNYVEVRKSLANIIIIITTTLIFIISIFTITKHYDLRLVYAQSSGDGTTDDNSDDNNNDDDNSVSSSGYFVLNRSSA